jgi:8-oxo-dGTP pyrophosphatase MutT (NUDIX family)
MVIPMTKEHSIDPKPAATVILIRDDDGELQTYLLRRSRRSSFFPGYYVFPGGAVDQGDKDSEFWLNHSDMNMEELTKRFGGDISGEDILAHCVAGIRETFEEAGALIAGDGKDAILADVNENRLTKGLQKGWLRDLVISKKWTLNFRSLSRWAHWITPKRMKVHFDTRFFLATLPEGQRCMPDLKEIEKGIWITPKQALASNLRGEIPLSPPTVVTIQELSDYPDIESLKSQWETRPWGETRYPRLLSSESGSVILQPWDPQVDRESNIDTKGFEALVLPPGEPFSRLYLHEGIWKPVRLP